MLISKSHSVQFSLICLVACLILGQARGQVAVQMANPQASFVESAGSASVDVLVNRTNLNGVGSAGTVRVFYNVVAGTATQNIDYSFNSSIAQSIDIPGNQGSITIPLLDDNIVELNETFQVIITGVTNLDPTQQGATLTSTNSTTTVTILDDDRSVQFLSATTSGLEGAGSASILVAWPYGGNPTDVIRVGVNLSKQAGDSADSPSDFNAQTYTVDLYPTQLSGSAQIDGGFYYQTVNIPFNDDNVIEPDEVFTATIVSVSNLSNSAATFKIGANQLAKVTILDDDGNLFFLDNNLTVSEAGGNVSIPVNLTRTNNVRDEIAVDYEVVTSSTVAIPVAGFATIDQDIPRTNTSNPGDPAVHKGTLFFGSNDFQKSIIIPILDDLLIEGDEIFTVHLSNPRDLTQPGLTQTLGSRADVTVTILDDDGKNVVQFANNVFVGVEGYKSIPRYVERNQSGIPGVIYSATNGLARVKLHVNRLGNQNETIRVDYTYRPLSADPTRFDFGVGGGTVTFGPNQSDQYIDIELFDDDSLITDTGVTYTALNGPAQGDQYFAIDLSSPSSNAAIGKRGTTLVKILDNDGPFTTIEALSQEEEVDEKLGNGSGVATVIFTRSGDPGSFLLPEQATFSIVNGTAVNGVDFTGTNGVVSFYNDYNQIVTNNGRGFAYLYTLTLPLINNNLSQGSRYFTVTLDNITPYNNGWNYDINGQIHNSIGNNHQTQIDIKDDDLVNVVEFGNAFYKSGEGGNALLTVNLKRSTGDVDTTVSVRCQTVDNSLTATQGLDYQPTSTVLTFLPGEIQKTVLVPIFPDNIIEGTESFNVQLSDLNVPSNATRNTVIGTQGTTRVDIEDANVTNIVQLTDTSISVDQPSQGTVDAVLNVAIDRRGDPSQVVNVKYQTVAAGATPGVNYENTYENTPTVLSFPAGVSTQQIRIKILASNQILDPKSFFVLLSDASGGTLGANFLATVIVNNPTNLPTSDIKYKYSSKTVSETVGKVIVTVHRQELGSVDAAASQKTLAQIDYTTVDGTALAGARYTAVSGTLTFAPGENEKNITIPIINDSLIQNQSLQSFIVRLTNPRSNVSLKNGTDLTVTIVDDESSSIVSIKPTLDNLGNALPYNISEVSTKGYVEMTVTREGSTATTETINYNTHDGDLSGIVANPVSAVAGRDYTAVSGTLTFEVGVTSKVVQIPIISNNLYKSDQTFTFSISNPSSKLVLGEYLNYPVLIKYVDISNISFISFDNSIYSVNEVNGSVTLGVSLDRRGDPNQVVPFTVTTQSGSAISGSDFVGLNSQSFQFGPGINHLDIPITIINDTLLENLETFTASLSFDPTLAFAGSNTSSTVTIVDDDLTSSTIQFEMTDLLVTEGLNTSAVVKVVRTGSYTGTIVNASYTTQDGTAKAGQNYVAVSGKIQFGVNQTEQFITVPINDDAIKQGTTNFQIILSNPGVNAQLGTNTIFQVSIDDNDTRSTFTTADTLLTVGENDGYVRVTVNRSGDTGFPKAVGYQTINGSAIGNQDYTTSTGNVIFAAGEVSKTVDIPIIPNVQTEPDKDFTFQLVANSVNGVLGSNASTRVIIKDAAPNVPALLNVSTRGFVGSNDNDKLIGGFVISGTTSSKKVAIRALGPSLAAFGIQAPLAASSIQIFKGSTLIASNTGWKTASASIQSDLTLAGLAPTNDLESAIVVNLAPGAYTIVVGGVNGASGVALVEAYDLSPDASIKFINISTRGRVGAGEKAMIGGFVIGGNQNKNIVVRGIGPSLTNYGVTSALLNPKITIFDSKNNVVFINDDWKSNQQSTLQSTGMSPSSDKEAAAYVTLAPGSYTVVTVGQKPTVSGGLTDDADGVGLVEIYEMP